MPRRTVLTARQRAALFDLPTEQREFLTHYILSDTDLSEIGIRRGPHNQLGFAVQLCALRYPGRLLQRREVIPAAILDFVGGQLGLNGDDLLTYGARDVTRYQHSAALQKLYGYRQFTGDSKKEVEAWLPTAAETVFRLRPKQLERMMDWQAAWSPRCADAILLSQRSQLSSGFVPML